MRGFDLTRVASRGLRRWMALAAVGLLVAGSADTADVPRPSGARLADVEACRALQVKYAATRDARDIEAYLSLFTEDARFEMAGRTWIGRDAFRAPTQQRMSGPEVRHVVSNSMVELTGPREAVGSSYATVMGVPEGEPKILAVLEYHDRYRLTGAGWRIAERRTVIVFPSRPHPQAAPAKE